MRLTLGVVLGGAFTFLLAISAPLQGAGLRAGAAKAVITPDVKAGKVYMAGFGNNRVAHGCPRRSLSRSCGHWWA